MNKGTLLGNEQVLAMNEYLRSPNNHFELLLHESGCLELFCTLNNQVLWHTNTFFNDIDAVRMQNDGNLVVYHSGGAKAAWASNTKGKGGDHLKLQDDGNLVLYKKDGSPVWHTNTFGQQGNMLMHLDSDVHYEQTIRTNEFLLSANKKYKLLLQANGDLVVQETATGKQLWSAGKAGSGATELRIQSDGNLVLYKGLKTDPVWHTGTNSKGTGSRLVLENYGDLVLYDKNGHITWENQQPDTTNWMSKLGKDLSLKKICIPGSHDAGMYTAHVEASFGINISAIATAFGEGIAKTQNKNIYDQLKLGVRYFDLRPKTWNGERYMWHGSAYGPKLSTVLDDVKNFMAEGKEETIILNFSHFEVFGGSIDEDFVSKVYDAFKPFLFNIETLKDAAGIYPVNGIFDVPLKHLRGKVIPLIEGNSTMYKDAVITKKRKGIYYQGNASDINAHEVFTTHMFDQYADKEDYHQMVEDQKNKFASFKDDKLFLLNWTLTPNGDALTAEIRKATGTSTAGIVFQAVGALITFGTSALISAPAQIAAAKSVIDKHSVPTLAGKANHRLLGDRSGNEFVFMKNKQGKMVNIINADYVESVNAVRACLRVMNA